MEQVFTTVVYHSNTVSRLVISLLSQINCARFKNNFLFCVKLTGEYAFSPKKDLSTAVIDQHLPFDSGEELEQGRLFLKVQDAIHTVCRFISSEIASDLVLDMMEEEMMKGDEQLGCEHYFELVTQILPKELSSIDFLCAKTYHRGECLALFYLEGVFYCQILRGEKEKTLLPDIKFPGIHQEGKGLTLKLNDRNEQIEGILWRKLSLWQTVPKKNSVIEHIPTHIDSNGTVSLASDTYGQCYIIMEPNKADASIRDVLFRFGSWNYCGEVQLLPELGLEDIEHVIPVLRVQQHKLSFLCHSSDMPVKNIFTEPLKYITNINALTEQEILSVERNIERINLDEDPENLFFEFETVPHFETIIEKSKIDCIACKSYRASGLVVMTVYFKGTFYVFLASGKENLQLLDSSFPSIIPSVGYNLKTYPSGIEGWSNLRKLSLWKVHKYAPNGAKDTCQPNIQEGGLDDKNTPCNTSLALETSTEVQESKTPNNIALNDHKSDPNEIETKQQKSPHGNFTSTRATCERKVNGIFGFHHLAPLKRESKLLQAQVLRGDQNNDIRISSWDSEGKPLFSN